MKNTRLVVAAVGFLAVIGVVALYILGSQDSAGLYPAVSISPDDRHITYAYNHAILIANTDGSEIKQLTFPKNEDHVRPEFSADGLRILFLSYSKRNGKPVSCIRVMNADGSDQKQVTFEEEHIQEAVFSADSAKIYFLRSPEFLEFYWGYSTVYRPLLHGVDIYSINSDGTERKPVMIYKAQGMSELHVSYDGTTLYFTLHDAPGNTLRAIPLDDPNQMTRVALGGSEREYRVSPDKKFVISQAISEQPLHTGSGYEYELFLCDMENRRRTRLTSLGGCVANPRFFQHEDRILFVRVLNWPTRDPVYELMSVRLDGTHLEKINLGPRDAIR